MAESIVQVPSGVNINVNLASSASAGVIGVSSPPSGSGSSKCPWAQLPSSPPTVKSINLTDIMSEQLAEGLQEHEEAIYLKEILGADTNGAGAGAIDPVSAVTAKATQDIETTLQELVNAAKFGDCGSDELIAQMLQMQYDREYDTNLKKVEQQYNGKSKVSVSLSNYMLSPSDDNEDSDSDDLMEPKAWDLFEKNEKAFPAMSGRGYVRINNTVVTKHDVTMNQRRNACKVMDFPPCIETGDGASFDMQLSNKVFNRLKVYSKAEEVRRTRVHDKSEKSTSDWAIDAKTKLMLYKMVNNGILAEVYGIVSTGKESVVIYATCPAKEEEEDTTEDDSSSMTSSTCTMNDGSSAKTKTPLDLDMTLTPAAEPDKEPEPKVVKFDVAGATATATAINNEPEEEECAIKVFKTSLNEFKTRDKYIKEDYRFKDRFSKQNPRKVIHMWAEKEMHNLSRMAKAGIPCPKVIVLKKHILVLSFIGKNMKPAPKLKDVKFPHGEEGDALLRSAYEQTIKCMKTMYNECKLIHADLSEFNILWHEKQCYFIDVSQSVEPAHPNALEFLYRDCTNIYTFFSKRKLENIHTPESLFTDISGIPLSGDGGTAVLNQIQDYEKNLELLTFATSDKSYPFEYCWEQSHSNRDDSD
jgi:RIO kinase 3